MTNRDGKAEGAENTAMRVSAVSIAVNLGLSVFKLIAGIFGRSAAMISDAVHSASDVASTIIVIIGIKIASKDSDDEHPYGHERLESAAAILLAAALALTGAAIGWGGFKKIFSGDYGEIKTPTMLALIAAAVSVAVKEAMYRYTRRAAVKTNSDALMADAWHHRSDGLSSIGSFAGILGARLGLPIADPVASVVICLFILKAALDIFLEAVDKMVDKACDKETVEKMTETVLSDSRIIALDRIKTRQFGAKCYVDIEISADGSSSLFAAHDIAEDVHQRIEKEFPSVKHCMVHVNPVDVKALQERIRQSSDNDPDRSPENDR